MKGTMRGLFRTMSLVIGLTLGLFSYAWSGEIEGQVLRTEPGGKAVPVTEVGVVVSKPIPGLPECQVTTDTNVAVAFTDADGMFSVEGLQEGLYQVCSEFEYTVDDPNYFNAKATASVVKRVRVPRNGSVKVVLKK